jgi:hypothetical protein
MTLHQALTILIWIALALAAVAYPVWHYVNSGLPR